MNEQELFQVKCHLLVMVNNALHARCHRSLDELVGLCLHEGLEMNASTEEVDEALRKITEYHLLDSTYDDALFEIELAIDRLNNGTYGNCVMCRGEIEPGVLEENPMARVCKKCFEMWRKFQ
ncbi:MAG: TraR/DksA C4-type zinc finger protein [Bacteroidota bacterium]